MEKEVKLSECGTSSANKNSNKGDVKETIGVFEGYEFTKNQDDRLVATKYLEKTKMKVNFIFSNNIEESDQIVNELTTVLEEQYIKKILHRN